MYELSIFKIEFSVDKKETVEPIKNPEIFTALLKNVVSVGI